MLKKFVLIALMAFFLNSGQPLSAENQAKPAATEKPAGSEAPLTEQEFRFFCDNKDNLTQNEEGEIIDGSGRFKKDRLNYIMARAYEYMAGQNGETVDNGLSPMTPEEKKVFSSNLECAQTLFSAS